MKHIYSIFLSAVSLLWMLSGCVEDPDMDTRLQKAKAPEVSETSMEGEAYASSITLKAQIMKENGLPVKECGVCWSTQTGTEPLENMRNKRYTKADKIENHNFTATISNLEDSTKYYVYAYAINDIDTAFSKTEGAYTTINGIGEVATLDVDSATVKATSTWVKGKVKNRGVGIEKLGFYYKKKKPEISNLRIKIPLSHTKGVTWQLSILSPARLRIWSRKLGIMSVLLPKISLASLLLMWTLLGLQMANLLSVS